MINTQVPEAFDGRAGGTLDLHSLFYTIQGEGPFTGCPAFFIRLAGCNLQCPFCDTEYTKGRERVAINKIIQRVTKLANHHQTTRLVVLTGGEPTRQNIDPLLYELISMRYHVQIESNGVLPPSDVFLGWVQLGLVTYVVSPKTRKICEQATYASAFKYVISADSLRMEDGLPYQALGHKAKPYIARPPDDYDGPVFVNPMDAQDPVANKANIVACRNSALAFGYRLGVQLHKIVGVD